MFVYRFPGRDRLLVSRQYSYAATKLHFANGSSERDILKNVASAVEQGARGGAVS
jgi:hypothetical protein